MLRFIQKFYLFSERALYGSEYYIIGEESVIEMQNGKFEKDLTFECRPNDKKYDNNLTWSQENGKIVATMHDAIKYLMITEKFTGKIFEENGKLYLKGKFKMMFIDFFQLAFIFCVFLYPIGCLVIFINEAGFSPVFNINIMMILVALVIGGPIFGIIMTGFTGFFKMLNFYRRRKFLRELSNSLHHISIAS